MQGEKVKERYVLISIPEEMLEEAGINEWTLIQISAEEGMLKIERVEDTSGYVCDEDCENCPLGEMAGDTRAKCSRGNKK